MNATQHKARILHDAIPGYMGKMTMEFDVRGATEWNQLKIGDRVAFTLQTTDTDGWIEELRKSADASVDAAQTNTAAATTPIIPIPRIAHYRPLLVGDTLPDYPLTNQLGQPIVLSQFRGEAIAFTFFFTTCPFPTMCPRMTTNFRDAYRDMMANADAPTNWRLFSITIDPEIDGPEALRQFALRNESNPAHWSYLTGDPAQIEILGRHFGLNFFREAGALNHNLRTVVVSPKGKITKIFTGNEWKSADLVEELQRALKE
ncbi:MAG: SCO family protein [Verrucomicrobia bacterium]|nr:SCO family protein [Verrucomicrobiota bacterium]MBI3867120.1 SCO family protein [Verrucomicrobiota bacterium]